MAIPIGPASALYDLDAVEARGLFRRLPTAVLIRHTAGFHLQVKSWYAVLADHFEDLSELDGKRRNEVRRGLRNCTVARIGAKELVEKGGAEVFRSVAAAHTGKGFSSFDAAKYRRSMLQNEGFEDIWHFWGVFGPDGVLIAYAQNAIYGSVEVNYSSIRLHPDYLGLYPMYALIYEMNRHYLGAGKADYVNDGFRSLLHDTNIQDFLIRKFGFKKVGVPMCIRYRPLFGILLKPLLLAYPFWPLLPGKVRSLLFQEKYHRCTTQEMEQQE
jgi:hypothetical protein